METFIMRDGLVVCSKAEARHWSIDDDQTVPASGDTVIRFRDDTVADVGRIGTIETEIEPPSQPEI